MPEGTGLNLFAENFLQEVIIRADDQEQSAFREDKFTYLVIESLIEAGEIDDAEVCYHKSRGVQVNGYSISSDHDCLDLFVSIFTQTLPPATVTKSQVETALRQCVGFLQKALDNFHLLIEESSPVFDMTYFIHEIRNAVTGVRIFLLTDGLTTVDSWPDGEIDDLKITFHIWDIGRLYRFHSSGQKREAIEIDFEKDHGIIIPCLAMPDTVADYKAYLAIIPGKVLAEVYGKYGPRLLERNVRSFLQARGKVNKGIRDIHDKFCQGENGDFPRLPDCPR